MRLLENDEWRLECNSSAAGFIWFKTERARIVLGAQASLRGLWGRRKSRDGAWREKGKLNDMSSVRL